MTGNEELSDLVLLGAGKMGTALIDGFVRQGLDASHILAIDPDPSNAAQACLARLGVAHRQTSQCARKEKPATLLLAVKPQIFDHVASDLKTLAGPQTLVLSVLAGVSLQRLAGALPDGQPIIRAMPNTPAAIGAGMTVCIPNENVTDTQRARADKLFASAGSVAWITDEANMDAVTAVSGSGPAYVFHLVEAMTEAGVRQGLDRALSEKLARETVVGAGALLAQANQSAADLRAAVTSPGGTTEAALNVLMEGDALKELMAHAVEAAKRRSEVL